MKVEVGLPPVGRGNIARAAQRAEELGYDRLTATETAHSAFVPLAVAAAATTRIELATSIAIAFARSPMVTAQVAWDLRELSGGRFQLGLGTQVKAQIVRRYSEEWIPPGPRIRDYLAALRAIWKSWDEGGTALQFASESYTFSLMTPEYSPGRSDHGPIPVTLAGVGAYMARIAGELAEGLRLPSFATVKYAREMLLPEIARSAQRAGRDPRAFDLCAQPWMAIGVAKDVAAQVESYRRAIAIHGANRTNRPILETHGWGEVAGKLHELSLESRLDDMTRLVSDDMVAAFVVQGPPDEAVAELRQRWTGVATTTAFSPPRDVAPTDDNLRRWLEALRS